MKIRWEDDTGVHIAREQRTRMARTAIDGEKEWVMTGDTLLHIQYDETGEVVVYDCKVRRVATLTHEDMVADDSEAPHD